MYRVTILGLGLFIAIAGCKTPREQSSAVRDADSQDILTRTSPTPMDIEEVEGEVCISRPFFFQRFYSEYRRNTGSYFDNLSLRNAYWLALFSHLAYGDEGTQRKILMDSSGVKRFRGLHHKFLRCTGSNCPRRPSTEGFFTVVQVPELRETSGEVTDDIAEALDIEPNDGVTTTVEGGPLGILSFRGTEPQKIQDLLVDGDIRHHRLPDGTTVHSGFYNGLMEVWPQIESEVKAFKRQYPDAPIWVTGHSLGAALATIATYLLVGDNNPYNIQGLYTFGSPRVGKPDFAEAWRRKIVPKINHWRFVNNEDMVTVIPRVGWQHVTDHTAGVFNREHARYVMWLDRKGQGYVSPDQQSGMQDSLIELIGNNIGSRGIFYVTDHGTHHYQRKLELQAFKGNYRVYDEDSDSFIVKGPITRCPEDNRPDSCIQYYNRKKGEPFVQCGRD